MWKIVFNIVFLFLPMVIVGGLTLSSTMNNFKIVLIKSHLLVKKKKKGRDPQPEKAYGKRREGLEAVCV